MSASLVGSEMCIRDRSERHQSSDPRSSNPQSAKSVASDVRGRNELGEACLLYTSDAADDM
eukprot:13379339-Alexandrium_andersonii.AAC.1